MKTPFLLFFLIFNLSFFSCSTTKITSSWKEPNKQVNLKNLNKVLVVALLRNETTRRKTEDLMVEYLNGSGVVSYNYLDYKINTSNENRIRDLIKKDGFDGVITMRLLDVEKQEIFNPNNRATYPNYYNTFGDYYQRSFPYYSNADYFVQTKIYTVETNVFSIIEDKIIWSGLTKTTNPAGVNKITDEIAKVVYKKMIREGFIKK